MPGENLTPEEQAAADAVTAGQENNAGTDGAGGSDDTPKTFTQDEMDAAIKDRVGRLQKSQDEKINAAVEQKLKEAKRLSELSDDDKASEALTQREKDLEARETRIQRQELLSDTESVLRDSKLDPTFAPFLIGEDKDTTFTNIKAFKTAFATALKAEVKNELSGKTPDASGNANKALTRAEIAAVKDVKQRLKLIEENPELYQK